MTVESELFLRLSTFPGLASLVQARIHPMLAPQNIAVPYAVFRRIGAERESAFGGDIGLVKSRYQFSSYASSYRGARDIAAQIRGAIQRWHEPAGDPPILDSFIEDDVDLFEADTSLYHALMEASIWHRE